MADIYTSCLIHSDHANGSTDISDDTGICTLSLGGSVAHSTLQAKFGASSIRCPSAGSYLLVNNCNEINPNGGAFTVDFWNYLTGGDTYRGLLSSGANGVNGVDLKYNSAMLRLYTSGTLRGSCSYALNAWNHVALVFTGAAILVFVNGALGINYATTAFPYSLTGWVFGRGFTNIQYYQALGFWDEIRVSKGIARWTAAFTPPTAPYGDVLTPKRNIVEQRYSLLYDPIIAILNQDYSLLFLQQAVIDHVWSLRQLARLDQLYWNMPQYRNAMIQRWGDCPFMRRLLDQDYGQLAQYRAEFDQDWWLPQALRNSMVQRYGIAEEALRSHCDLVYDLSEYDRHRAQLQQLWVLISAGSIVLNYQVRVIAINGPDVLALTETTGQVTELHPFNITQEMDQGEYHMSGELQLAAPDGFAVCRHLRTIVQITVNGRTARYVVEDPRREKGSDGSIVYVVPLASPTLLLGHSDSPYSSIEDQPLVGMARDLVEMLADPVATVDWRMVNRYIPSPVWHTNGKRRIELIRELVNCWGGIVQTLPDGTLVCRPKYPVNVDRWPTAEPDVQLSDQDDFFSISPSADPRDGYNCFYLADTEVAGDGITIVEMEEDAWTRRVKVYLQPWDEAETVTLRHSGGWWVTVVSLGIGIGSETKTIEIVGGAGQLPLPVWVVAGYDYQEADLGVLTAVDDGTVTTEIAGNSLVEITWATRYHQFLVHDPRAEDVQIWPEVN